MCGSVQKALIGHFSFFDSLHVQCHGKEVKSFYNPPLLVSRFSFLTFVIRIFNVSGREVKLFYITPPLGSCSLLHMLSVMVVFFAEGSGGGSMLLSGRFWKLAN